MSSSEEYRRLAAKSIALAEKAIDPADKARLLQMAQAWRELADKQDAQPNRER